MEVLVVSRERGLPIVAARFAGVLEALGVATELATGPLEPRLRAGPRPRLLLLLADRGARLGPVIARAKEHDLGVVVAGVVGDDAALLDHGADLVLSRPTVASLGEGVLALLAGRIAVSSRRIEGAAVVDGEARVVRGPPTRRAAGDALPLPAYHRIDWTAFPDAVVEVALRYGGVRASPERLAEELAVLGRIAAVREASVVGPLLEDRAYAERFAAALIEAEVRLSWSVSGRVGAVDEALLARLDAAGCRRIDFRLDGSCDPARARAVAHEMHRRHMAFGAAVDLRGALDDWASLEDAVERLVRIAPVDYRCARGRGAARLVGSLVAAEYDLALEFSWPRYLESKALRATLATVRAARRVMETRR